MRRWPSRHSEDREQKIEQDCSLDMTWEGSLQVVIILWNLWQSYKTDVLIHKYSANIHYIILLYIPISSNILY